MEGNVLAIGDYGLCITLAASASAKSSLHFVPCASLSSQMELPLPAEWAAAVIIDLPSAKTEIHTSVLPAVLRVMSKGARLSITHRDKDADSKAWVDRLVFAGFVDAKAEKSSDGSWESTACKPVWDAGAAVPLSLKKKSAAPVPAPAKKVWTISADDGDDLMDQDSLLNDDDLKPTPKAKDDCEAAEGRKACKNCSCGRAEAEAAGEAKAAAAAPTSACGSCYLGDAFRCDGCPYKGMPPFKPGERVTIN